MIVMFVCLWPLFSFLLTGCMTWKRSNINFALGNTTFTILGNSPHISRLTSCTCSRTSIGYWLSTSMISSWLWLSMTSSTGWLTKVVRPHPQPLSQRARARVRAFGVLAEKFCQSIRFKQRAVVNITDNRGKTSIPLTRTDFVYADSLNTSSVFFLLAKPVAKDTFYLIPTQVLL